MFISSSSPATGKMILIRSIHGGGAPLSYQGVPGMNKVRTPPILAASRGSPPASGLIVGLATVKLVGEWSSISPRSCIYVGRVPENQIRKISFPGCTMGLSVALLVLRSSAMGPSFLPPFIPYHLVVVDMDRLREANTLARANLRLRGPPKLPQRD